MKLRFRLDIDTSDTFTDEVVGDAIGILTVGEAPTIRERLSRGILVGVVVAAIPMGIGIDTLLPRIAVFIYRSTRATNAIPERRTVRTELLVTVDSQDTSLWHEGGKADP